ncbi:MAG: hypothetical protein IPG01_01930 [Chitinophagaceae bacterium]|nr:hypothetical protein [Chitinophagaceae bacterium]
MQEIGQQYSKDDRTDPSGFLRRARLHQSVFRANQLNLPFDTYGNCLTKEDGENGKNFYDGYGVFDAVKKYRKYNKPLYSNLLRSEHIPFNIFIPLDKDRNYCKNVISDIVKSNIISIDKIEIEYAPKPKINYLNDRTSFDAYIEYTNFDGTKGMIGIEVKYTEKEYKLQTHSKQEKDINDKNSLYFSVTNRCGLYKENAIEILPTDNFRQVWRNHILGESILLADNNKFQHFTSLTLFPADNSHFINTSKEYINLLTNNDNKFIALTYEDFFALLSKHCPDSNYKKWLDYLTTRYIVTND